MNVVVGLLEGAWNFISSTNVVGIPLIVWLIGIVVIEMIMKFIRGIK